jgi:ferric-dicitrate binding protein FerR (iron transport regulator)
VPDSVDAQFAVAKIITRAENEASENLSLPNRKRGIRKWLIAASVVAIGFTAWSLIPGNNSDAKKEITEASIVAQNGSRIRSLLPDGTVVWLNAGSNLKYKEFTESKREVYLEGEAYFDVVKQPDRPFIVHTSGIDIKVLGTAFNVKSYPEDKNVETTLFKGQVMVFRAEETEANAVELKPNEKLIVSKEAAKEVEKLSLPIREKALKNLAAGLTITYIDSTKKENERFETAWLYSRLEFRGDDFETLARKMERWYNVRIIFEDEQTKRLNFNGSFEKETVMQAFVALKAAVPFVFNIKGNEIFVTTSD